MNTSDHITNEITGAACWTDLITASATGIAMVEEPPFPFRARIASRIPPRAKLLEICSGRGQNTRHWTECGAQVTAMDESSFLLQFLREKFTHAGIECPMTIRGQPTDIPVGDGYFDCALCLDSFSHIDNPRLAMQEIARVLRPGGTFCLNTASLSDGNFGQGTQVGPQDFIYKATLFRFYSESQFAGIYKDIFRVIEFSTFSWSDSVSHNNHNNLFYWLEKI